MRRQKVDGLTVPPVLDERARKNLRILRCDEPDLLPLGPKDGLAAAGQACGAADYPTQAIIGSPRYLRARYTRVGIALFDAPQYPLPGAAAVIGSKPVRGEGRRRRRYRSYER